MRRGHRGIGVRLWRYASVLLATAVLVSLGVAFQVSRAETAEAAVASEFDPGFIISDSLFYDARAMSAQEIQTFLDGKIGTCRTDRCLNVAVLPVASRAASYSPGTGALFCSAIDGGNLRVSELIYRTQVACGISAKVILVTLEKEQSLVTSRSPSDAALRAAMGMGCPDTSPCNDAFAGLANQIMSGAKQLKVYKAGNFLRQPGVHYIGYSPNSACGGTNLNIRNYATAALYNYTPYQPNAPALNNLYGTGDGCSSYGNRNFWRLYTDWFGKTSDIIPEGVSVVRIGGSDRYEVAASISAAYFSPGVPVVFVASGETFPDAISAGAAAANQGGPVLLVESRAIPSSVRAELVRLAPARIVVAGGPATVSESVLAELAEYAPDVERIGGQDRQEVSRALAESAFSSGAAVAYLATGGVFADALSSGAAAGSLHAPVILIDGSLPRLDDRTRETLEALGVSRVYVSGGPASVSPGIYESLVQDLGASAVSRFDGPDRFSVSAAISRTAFPTAGTFFVASGWVFPDALSAAPAAVAARAPLYITPTECVTRAQVEHMIAAGATKMVVVGGPASVSGSAVAFRNC